MVPSEFPHMPITEAILILMVPKKMNSHSGTGKVTSAGKEEAQAHLHRSGWPRPSTTGKRHPWNLDLNISLPFLRPWPSLGWSA